MYFWFSFIPPLYFSFLTLLYKLSYQCMYVRRRNARWSNLLPFLPVQCGAVYKSFKLLERRNPPIGKKKRKEKICMRWHDIFQHACLGNRWDGVGMGHRMRKRVKRKGRKAKSIYTYLPANRSPLPFHHQQLSNISIRPCCFLLSNVPGIRPSRT